VAGPIFRQAALERMANPERLDSPLRLVSRSHWLLLGALALAILAALTWAALTQAPVKLTASGILIDRAGLVEVVANQEGQLQSLLVSPGDLVAPGQAVATLGRPELNRQLLAARGELSEAEARFDRLQTFYVGQNQRQSGAEAERLATVARTQAALSAELTALQEKAAKLTDLVAKGFVRRDDLLQTQITIADLRERIARLGEDATGVRVGAVQRQGQTGLALLDEQKAVAARRRTLQDLEQRLAEQQTIRAQTAGRVVEVKVNGGDVVGPGSAIATVAPLDQSGRMVALLYVPAGQGKRIRPGMAAEIAPSTVERAQYGYIRGRVISVAPLPATSAGMRRVLRNDQLVEQLRVGGAPIEVRVALVRDPTTRTGFAWSASKGPAGEVSVGTLAEGRVVVDHIPVIAWLMPGVRRGDG
jgi:HlyD family secretion protein